MYYYWEKVYLREGWWCCEGLITWPEHTTSTNMKKARIGWWWYHFRWCVAALFYCALSPPIYHDSFGFVLAAFLRYVCAWFTTTGTFTVRPRRNRCFIFCMGDNARADRQTQYHSRGSPLVYFPVTLPEREVVSSQTEALPTDSTATLYQCSAIGRTRGTERKFVDVFIS